MVDIYQGYKHKYSEIFDELIFYLKLLFILYQSGCALVVNIKYWPKIQS